MCTSPQGGSAIRCATKIPSLLILVASCLRMVLIPSVIKEGLCSDLVVGGSRAYQFSRRETLTLRRQNLF